MGACAVSEARSSYGHGAITQKHGNRNQSLERNHRTPDGANAKCTIACIRRLLGSRRSAIAIAVARATVSEQTPWGRRRGSMAGLKPQRATTQSVPGRSLLPSRAQAVQEALAVNGALACCRWVRQSTGSDDQAPPVLSARVQLAGWPGLASPWLAARSPAPTSTPKSAAVPCSFNPKELQEEGPGDGHSYPGMLLRWLHSWRPEELLYPGSHHRPPALSLPLSAAQQDRSVP